MTHRMGNAPPDRTSRQSRSIGSRFAALKAREAVALTALGVSFAVAAGVVWHGALSTETRIAATLVTTAGLVLLTVGVCGCVTCWRRRPSPSTRRGRQ